MMTSKHPQHNTSSAESAPTSHLKPWYKHAHLWLVIILPLVAVCMSSIFVYLAFNGGDDLVRDDWYMDGKTLEQDLSRDSEASMGQYNAHINLRADGLTTVVVTSKSNKPLPARMILNLFHITKAVRDRKFILQQTDNKNTFTTQISKGDLLNLQGGFTLELDGMTWRLRQEVVLPTTTAIELSAAPLTPTATKLTPLKKEGQ